MKSNITFLAILMVFISCGKKCELKPIPSTIFDLGKIQKSVVLKCGKETDSLTFNDKYDIYTNESYKGIMKYEECGHSKAYVYNFRNETINVSLTKTDQEILELDLTGWFNKFNDVRIVEEKDLLENKEFIFIREKDCDSAKSQIKKITLKGYRIQSIVTIDDKIWIPK